MPLAKTLKTVKRTKSITAKRYNQYFVVHSRFVHFVYNRCSVTEVPAKEHDDYNHHHHDLN